MTVASDYDDACAALQRLEGLEVEWPRRGDWGPVEDTIARDILLDWRRRLGRKAYEGIVEQLAAGHEMTSPVMSIFNYRAGSLAGGQQQLF